MDIFGGKRMQGESVVNYKIRRKDEKIFFKNRLKGIVAIPRVKKGNPYIKAIHGDIQVTISK